MSLYQRRLLFYSFFLLFILIAPFALLYATGQKINWQELSIQKTGSLVIESEPNNADIFINNRRPTAFIQRLFNRNVMPRTTATLSNLTPGPYVVRLELSGYFPWEKEITIKPNEVYNLGPVELFKHSSPQLQTSLSNNNTGLVSPDKNIILLPDANNLRLINFKKNIDQTISLSSSRLLEAQWSAHNQWCLINQEFVINENGETSITLKELAPLEPQFLRWDNNQAHLLFFEDKEILYSLNLNTKKVTKQLDLRPLLVGRELIDYQPNGRQLYLIFRTNQETQFITIDQNNPSRQSTLLLPNGQFHFLPTDAKTLLIEQATQTLYLIEQPLPLFLAPRLTIVAENYKVGRWSNDTLIYATPLEIRQWDNNKEQLVGRLGGTIIDVALIPNRQALLIATKTSISLWPINNQPYTPTTTILEMTDLQQMLSVTDTTLTFRGEFNNQSGIFSLDY